jgi:predicted RecA/RadA family phage recombinase
MTFSIGERVRVVHGDFVFEGVVVIPQKIYETNSWREGRTVLIDLGVRSATAAFSNPLADHFRLGWTSEGSIGVYVELHFIEPLVFSDGLENWI